MILRRKRRTAVQARDQKIQRHGRAQSAWRKVDLSSNLRIFIRCPGHFLPRCLYIVKLCVITCCSVPFDIKREGTLVVLETSKTWRKCVAAVLHSAVTLRVIFLLSLVCNSNFVFAHSGFLTVDMCVYTMCSVISGVCCSFGIMMMYFNAEVPLIYNAMRRIDQNFTGNDTSLSPLTFF